jgi:hypothetical protein
MSHAVPHSASLRIGWGRSPGTLGPRISQKVLAEIRAWCIFTAFWGEQQAVAAIVAAACIFFKIVRSSARLVGLSARNERLRLPFQFDNQTYSVPRSCRMKEKRLRQQLVGPSPRRCGWSLSRVMVVSDDGFATPSLCPGCRRPFFASVDAPLG